jgi:hypothetical protein
MGIHSLTRSCRSRKHSPCEISSLEQERATRRTRREQRRGPRSAPLCKQLREQRSLIEVTFCWHFLVAGKLGHGNTLIAKSVIELASWRCGQDILQLCIAWPGARQSRRRPPQSCQRSGRLGRRSIGVFHKLATRTTLATE